MNVRSKLTGLVAGMSLALAGAAVVTAPAAQAADWEPPRFERSVAGTGLASLYAWGVQHNPVTDEVLVGDYFNFNVRRFDTDGNLLGSFGRPASERRGQPYSLAVDHRNGDIYVPEISDGQGAGWFAKYDSAGNFLYEFDTDSRYNAWVATDADGFLYVADSHYWNDEGFPAKIRKYRTDDATKSVTEVASFGEYGTGPGKLNTVRGIAVADNGDIYVADGGNNVISHFTNDGDHVRTLTGPFAGDLRGITLDEDRDTLWLVDAQGSQLERFDLTTGNHTGTFASGVGSGPGQFADGGRQVDVTSDGDVWVADYGNFRVHRYNPAGGFVAAYPENGDAADGLFSKVRDVAVGPDGDIWAVDVWNHRFQRFDADGSHTGTWGRRGSDAPYGMNYPRGVGVDPATGHLWVANTRGHFLRVYDENQSHLFDVGDGEDSTDPGSFRWPLDIDFAGDTAVITDYVGSVVKGVSTLDGRELWSVDSRRVHGVAVDEAADRFYAVGPSRDRIDIHRLSDGEELGTMGVRGDNPGEFRSPWDIELIDGTLYTSDAYRNTIVAYGTDGTFLGEVGSTGGGPGELRSPSGLASDAQGRLYVADSGNFRIQVFGTGGTATGDGQAPQLGITSPAAGGTVAPGPVEITGTATDPDGVGAVEVFVRDRTTGENWHAVSSAWGAGGRWAVAALAGADPTQQTFRWVLPSVKPGHEYLARFRAYDAHGAVSSSLPTVVFTAGGGAPVDRDAPELVLDAPTQNEAYGGLPARFAGSATDDTGVDAVQVAVRDRSSGLWWNADNDTWGQYRRQDAVVADRGARSSSWHFDFDDSADRGSGDYYVAVRAVDISGRAGDTTGVRFGVGGSGADVTAPELVLTTPQGNEVLGGRPATLSGTASDDTGVTAVEVAVKDRTGNQWWDPVTGSWGSYRWVDADLASSGATSTGWTFDFDDTADQGSGDYYVRVRSRDAAGNTSAVTGRRFSIN